VGALAKELFLFAYLSDDYNEDEVILGLAEMDRQADTAARIAVQAVAAGWEACAKVADDHARYYMAQAAALDPEFPQTANGARSQGLTARAIAAAIRARAWGEEAPMPPEPPQG